MLQKHLATDSSKRKIIMIASVSIPTVPDFVGMLETRIVRELAGLADEWGHCVSALTPWEDDHLLDNPTADLLASHKTTIENLWRLGDRFDSRRGPDSVWSQTITRTGARTGARASSIPKGNNEIAGGAR